jgi:secreted trypsin-like serine protease
MSKVTHALTHALVASVATLVLLVAASCVDVGSVEVTRRPIIGGQVDKTDLAAVALTAPQAGQSLPFCSGTLIAPRVVLTAGHCIMESGIQPTRMRAFFGTTMGDGSAQINVTSGTVHPGYYMSQNGAPVNDVAILTLSQDAPVAPAAWQRTPLPDITGQPVTLVGYGVTNAQRQSGNGTRRVVQMPITLMDDLFLYYGDNVSGTCQGDSGGPMFLDVNGTPTIVGITSWGDATCVQVGGNTRVDIFADFIRPLALLPVNVVINSPTEGETVGSSFDVDVTATSLAGIAEVDVFVDGQIAAAAVEPPFVFSMAGVADGPHVLKVRGTGADQNTGEKTVNVTVAGKGTFEACIQDAECSSGICVGGTSGQSFCSQTCQTDADCPGQASCDTAATGRVCGAPGSVAAGGGCRASGGPADASSALLLLGLVLGLAASRRR